MQSVRTILGTAKLYLAMQVSQPENMQLAIGLKNRPRFQKPKENPLGSHTCTWYVILFTLISYVSKEKKKGLGEVVTLDQEKNQYISIKGQKGRKSRKSSKKRGTRARKANQEKKGFENWSHVYAAGSILHLFSSL